MVRYGQRCCSSTTSDEDIPRADQQATIDFPTVGKSKPLRSESDAIVSTGNTNHPSNGWHSARSF
jgi:hypothetical protein